MAADPDPQVAQGRAAESRGDFRSAAALYQGAIRRNPGSGEAHHALGCLLARMGQAHQAIPPLKRATALDPSNGAYHQVLGLVFTAVNQRDHALEAHNEARRCDPSNADAHVDAAVLLEMGARAGEARQAVSEALAADPDHERARIMAIRLDFRAAGSDGEEALPGYRDALRRIADATANPVHRALALDILVDVCERLGEYDEAWTAITQCNEADRALTGAAFPTPAQRRERLRTIGDMASIITPERAERWRGECPDDGLPSPAILMGFVRSGTTMTERALDAHPRLISVEERPTFKPTLEHAPTVVDRAVAARHPGYEVIDALTTDQVAHLRRTYWRHVCRYLNVGAPPTDTVVLDKMPLLVTNMPFVTRLFPDAKVLFAIRDPRDVCLSCMRQRFGYAQNVGMSFFLDVHETAALYEAVMGAWLATRHCYQNPLLEVRYENTVANFEERIREMLAFLGLEFDDAVLSFHRRTDRIHSTPSFHAVARKVSTKAIGRWKMYESHLAPVLPTLAPFLSAFGYET